jgi:EipB-like
MRRPAAFAARSPHTILLVGLHAVRHGALGVALLAGVVATGGLPWHDARAADRSAQLAVPPTPLAAHRALYTLTLDNRSGSGTGSDVVGASGSMGYEVLDACDGWATHQTLDMVVVNGDGQNIHMISDYTTWEAKDGLSFRFHTRQTTDDAVTSQIDGDAKLDAPGAAGTARYSSPKEATKPLPAGTLFPMAHTAALLAAARAGKKFIALPLFDGTSDDGAEDTSVVVLDTKPPEAGPYPALSALSSARVHLAFFERAASSITPDYEVSMRYWENGVADGLQMNFGDFVMDAKLTDLKMQPHRC